MLKAVTRQASLVDSKIAGLNASSGKPRISTAYFFDHYATPEDVAVMVTEEDFIDAERELVPSVSAKELEHYQTVRAQFEKVEDKPARERGGDDASGAGGIPEWQRSGRSNGDDSAAARPKGTGKGKGREKERVVDRKGKGKEKDVGGWSEGESDEDGRFHGEGFNGSAGSGKGKGKGKEKAVDMGFHDEPEDEGLY